MMCFDQLACLSFQSSFFRHRDFISVSSLINKGVQFQELPSCPDTPTGFRKLILQNPNWLERMKRDYDLVLSGGLKILHPLSCKYPELWQHSADPPVIMTYKGEEIWFQQKGLSVVGSREPSIFTKHWITRHFSEFLKLADVFVVSGAARGVDQLAHAEAISVGRPTVAILPTGMQNPYPREFSRWMEEILSVGGAVMSEFAPTQKLFKSQFRRRNRLIATMTPTVFLVESAEKSGSLMTAHLALDESREVVTLPVHPGCEETRGNLKMIEEGANWITNSSDLAEAVLG